MMAPMNDSGQLAPAAQILFRIVLPIVAFATPLMLFGIAVRARQQGLSKRNAVLLFVMPLAAALPLIGLMFFIYAAAMGR